MFYHETSYHWALFYAFGNSYWWKEKGYEQNHPLDYNEQSDNFEQEFHKILALEAKN